MAGFLLVQGPPHESYMVPVSYQYEDTFHNYSCCFDLDPDPCCRDCTIDSGSSRLALVADYCSAVDTDMTVVDTEQRRHMDMDSTTWEPSETDTGDGHLSSQHLSPLPSFS